MATVAVVALTSPVASARANRETTRVPNPTVKPAAGGHGVAANGLRYRVSQFGYQEKEYLFGGNARSYRPATSSREAYRSRMIVWTPKDPARFNGTTVVEWAEVSDFGQFELTVELNYQSQMLEAGGYAFALVSAQRDGVCQPSATGPGGCVPTSLKGADPARYGSLKHPGDAYSFDIFSQALQAIKNPAGVAPLGKLRTRTIIAEGFQASVDKYFINRPPVPPTVGRPFSNYGALNAYISSGADKQARLADAFLVDGAAPPVEPARYRVPTLHYLDESAVRRTVTPDRSNHVTWEVTGAPHADRWAANHFSIPSSAPPAPKLNRNEELALRDKFDDFGQEPDPSGATCAPSPRAGSLYPRRFLLSAAVADLRAWVQTGRPAPSAPRIRRVGPLPDSPEKKLSRDVDGNAIGGLRSPIIQAPVAAYNGEACVEAGTTIPFSPARLAQRYPTHKSYVLRLLAATNQSVAGRLLLCEDAETIMRKASKSTVGGPDGFTATPSCARDSS